MANREDIACRIADGLAGYFQYVNATQLLAMPGEDTAQFVMCQILQAQQRYRVAVSAQPPPWDDARRVDAGLLSKAADSTTWYGVAEVKWITSKAQRDTARFTIIEDCARVASVKTNYLNAKFMVVGFTDGMLAEVFDRPHDAGTNQEHQRALLARLLGRTPGSPAVSVSHAELTHAAAFPAYQGRVPTVAQFTTGLEAQLLTFSPIKSSNTSVGEVLVWQVNKRSGPG